MALDSGEVRLAPFGHVYVAAVGTAAPVDVTVPFGAGWRELGYLDEDGVGITPSVDVQDISAWQSLVPVKQTLTGVNLELKFNMIQVNQATTSLFFFGEDWVSGGGISTLTLTSNPSLDERAVAIEWNDDNANTNRLIVPRGLITDRDDLNLNRQNATAFGVTFRALDSNGVIAALLSDDPNLQFS